VIPAGITDAGYNRAATHKEKRLSIHPGPVPSLISTPTFKLEFVYSNVACRFPKVRA